MATQAISLVGTGITLGIVHVLTGPDHLSAIATLSANVGSLWQAFWLGVRWGIGHSTGLILVAIIFIVMSLSNSGDEGDGDVIKVPDKVSHSFEALVGIFMLLLGAYGVQRAWRKRPKGIDPYARHNADSSTGAHIFEDPTAPLPSQVDGREQPGTPLDQQRSQMERIASYQTPVQKQDPVDTEFEDETSVDDDSQWQSSAPTNRRSCCNAITSRVSTTSMALLAGLVHGLAGPGGVLGVVPAVQLHSARLASIYLISFCCSSTLTMGAFAALYGSCSSRVVGSHQRSLVVERAMPGADEEDDEDVLMVMQSQTDQPTNRDFWIECLSACLSIIVGLLWLILLSLGKLDEVFP